MPKYGSSINIDFKSLSEGYLNYDLHHTIRFSSALKVETGFLLNAATLYKTALHSITEYLNLPRVTYFGSFLEKKYSSIFFTSLNAHKIPNFGQHVGGNFNRLAPELFFLNFSTLCTKNVNNTGTKQVSIMKQTAF